MSRIQAGRLELVVEPIDLVAVVNDAVDVAETLPNAPTVHVSPTRKPIMLQGDAVRLEQVFVNLLSNAVEHAAGSPTIEVTVRRSGSVAMVEVRDFGPGIAAGLLSMLFRPYTQLGKKPSAGLGLGLYLAREIVTAHGGTIEAESAVGEGTTITVRLSVGKGAPSKRGGRGGRGAQRPEAEAEA
jgi:two-component system CheB/CheR fusion protein